MCIDVLTGMRQTKQIGWGGRRPERAPDKTDTAELRRVWRTSRECVRCTSSL